ncbi:MAG TPA: hypothetical protein VEA38_22055 [Terriglobales bacterium]|nr:hypothetical protein [Terriglobales bacterium]
MIAEWTKLKCDCGGDLFMPLVRLKYRDSGSGTSSEPAGHKCAACGAVVDNAYMIRLIEIQKKRAEIARLSAEVESAAPAKPAADKKPAEAAAAGRG